MKGFKSPTKKGMTLLLSTMMVVSMMPVQTLAYVWINPSTPEAERLSGIDQFESVDVTTWTDDEYANVNANIGNITSDEVLPEGEEYEDYPNAALYVEAEDGCEATVTAKNVIYNGEEGDGVAIANGYWYSGGTVNLDVNGNVSGTDVGLAVYTDKNGESQITVNGNVSSIKEGLRVNSHDNGTSQITVNGNIHAGQDGVYAYTDYEGTATITINGNVIAGQEGGIIAEAGDNGTTTIIVNGDVTSNESYGIYADCDYGEDELGTVNICVEGTVTGETIGIKTWGDDDSRRNVTVTAWAIKPVTLDNGEEAVAGYRRNGEFVRDSDFEETINYIIKVDTNVAGATLSASQETQTEGERVYLRINLQDGYEITGAYDDNGIRGKSVLQQDENGYYVIVPKGGGVYLTVAVKSKAKYLPPQPTTVTESSEAPTGATLCASIAQMITEAAQGATVRVTITSGSSLCKTAVDALEARPDVTLVVDYAYNGGMYEATIPGGDSRPDLAQYKNAAGGIDFETLTVHFGGKQIF